MIDIDRDAIVQLFIAEAEERLGRMEEALLALEGSPGDPDLLGGIFRDAHTLKGNAVSLGFADMAELAHALEDLLDRARQGAIALGPDRVAALLRQIDALRDALEAVVPGVAGAAAERARITVAPPAPPAERRTLRVDVAKLDRLMDLASEIAIARGRVQQLLEAEGSTAALAAHRDSDRAFLDLQELILRARMVSVGPAFRAYARTVRDVAEAHGKQARLVVEGGDVEVDTSIIEHLRDALTHMVRNALDHGIEPPDRRAARGKDPCGTVGLRAFREAGNIVVELSDDGGGLDRARIAERARGRADAMERASDADLQRLIFEPGFSTADRVTELSGRGVGMDVVRRNVEALRGSVTVASREGQGATFSIRLPLTLAIIDGFGTVVGGETYVVPTEAVIECLELPRTDGPSDGGRTVINLRGEPLPCLRLRDHFALPAGGAARENVVVVRHEGGRAGLVVDGLLGERQTVIKPLGPLFRARPGIAGSAILGSGRVALILDVSGLLREALPRPRPGAGQFLEAASAS